MNTALIPAALVLLLAGCTIDTRRDSASTGPARTETLSVERDKSELLRVNLNMKAGELRLSGGASKFLEGTATYNDEGAKPIVKYVSGAGAGHLSIEQPSGAWSNSGNAKYLWDLRLPGDVPLDLTIDFGAGEASINAANLSPRRVEVRIGAGRLEMDLRGNPPRDYDVRVRGGVGEAVIRLPKHVGVYATAVGGLGSINAHGLRKERDHWINDAYDTAQRKIRLDIQGGIGEISLISE